MVSILIVNYNTGDLLRECLASIKNSVKVPYEVIIVDNNSKDDSLENLPEVQNLKIHREFVNHGFPKGCNIAAGLASGETLHLLNPDTVISSDINDCYRQAESEPASIHVTRIYDSQANTDKSAHALPTLRNMFFMFVSPKRVVRWYVGASIVISSELFSRLGRLSEDYFMYGDDVDFFYKAYRAGVKTVESPARIIHHQGGASRKVWSEKERRKYVERSAMIFARKFGLQFDYFIFKHLAFLRFGWREPELSIVDITSYWRELLRKT